MIKKAEYPLVFVLGGLIYNLLEIIWRGYTHWSMTVAGGLCCLCIHFINWKWQRVHIVYRCLIGSLIITAIEFVVGVIVNLVLDLSVWDYSNMPLNVLGQICPLFSALWFLLSFPVCYFSGVVRTFFDVNGKSKKQIKQTG